MQDSTAQAIRTVFFKNTIVASRILMAILALDTAVVAMAGNISITALLLGLLVATYFGGRWVRDADKAGGAIREKVFQIGASFVGVLAGVSCWVILFTCVLTDQKNAVVITCCMLLVTLCMTVIGTREESWFVKRPKEIGGFSGLVIVWFGLNVAFALLAASIY